MSITLKLNGEEKFDEFTYSKNLHMDYFIEKDYDIELYGSRVDPENCSLKVYQDLLVFAFIKENLKPGSKMLDIGGGYSRILNYFKNDYECWNIDKLEGLGNGPTEMQMEGIKLVLDYMGNFNSELPDNYFDFVFSISALEHVPEDDLSLFEKIYNDINRVSKDDAFVFHCFDVVIKDEYVWSNKLLYFFFNSSEPLNEFLHFDLLKKKTDMYVMSEKYYEENWRPSTNRSYEDFGKPLSYNILWKKKSVVDDFSVENFLKRYKKRLPLFTKTKNTEYLDKNPSYVFHHLIKSGGTSVFMQLNKWFQVESDYRSFVSGNQFLLFKNSNTYNKYKLNTENFNSDMCMISHFDTPDTFLHKRYPEILNNKDKFRIFTFVRDPLGLSTSLYYFSFKTEEQRNKYPLKDFLNYHYNTLATLFPCNDKNYKEVLDRYFFIGLVERMQESFDKFAELTGKKRIVLPVDNKSNKDVQYLNLKKDEKFIEQFKKRNYLDYLIYDYCKEKYFGSK